MKAFPVLLVALSVAGCSSTPPREAAGVGGDATRSAALARADFERATEVRIELRDQGFKPETLRLELGKPYRLTVENIGGNAHYLNAPEFLRSIAARHVVMRDEVEIEAPYFSRFEVARRGGRFQLEFVPLERGVYRAYCHLEGDAHRGVEARIVVE